MKRSRFATGIASAVGFGFALTLLWLLGTEPPVALTNSPHYVAPGANCGAGYTPCHATVQQAVDAAIPGDIIKVAAGTYSTVLVRPVPLDYPFPPATGVVSQVVYITKTVTIQGGYTTTNWTTPHPTTQPTILDAKRKGRVLLIADNAAPTVEGLFITGGDAVGQSGYSRANYDTGGGVYIITSTPTLSNCVVFTNSAGYLGGWIDSAGGGVYIAAPASLYNNQILNNAATFGGGLFLENNHVTLTGNIVRSNFAVDRGGGLYMRYTDSKFVNSIFADNQANETGSAIYMRAATPNLFHTTLAHNTGGDGAGVIVGDDYVNFSTAKFTNTILVGHTTGITVSTYDNLGMYGVLWFDNDSNITGPGTIKVTNEITGDPDFVNPAVWNYHLGVGSAAIDAGIPTSVNTDLDGIPRPQGTYPDLGAYEAAADVSISKAATPATVNPGGRITYTLTFVNGGVATATGVLITDSVPISVTGTSVSNSGAMITQISPSYVWRVQDLVAGQGGVITITGVVANPLAAGVFVNTASIGTATADTNPANNSQSVSISVPVNGILTVTKDGTGSGTVTSVPAGMNCGSACSANFGFGTVVTLTAAPDAGAVLTSWGGACSGYEACVVTMNASKTVTATFNPNQRPVANAGPDQVVKLGSMVMLNGSASYDPDHQSLSYLWTQTGGGSVVLASPTLSVTTFTAPSSATVLTFTLTVTDAMGLADTTPDSVQISVRYLTYLPVIQNKYIRP